VNERHSFDFAKTLTQGIKVKKTARTMRPRRFDREIDFSILCDVNLLNDVKFRVGPVVVRVLP
jgi:hypothetical protein